MSIKNRLISSRSLFIISLIVLTLVVISTWVVGIKDEKTIEENALTSLSIIACCIFFFLTIGLYQGLKMKNTYGNPLEQKESKSFTLGLLDFSATSDLEIDGGDGIEGLIVGIISWVFITIALGIFLWFFSVFAWMFILLIAAMLYWIFYRALRLVFKKSPVCRGHFIKSFSYAFGYTFLYTSWLFLLFYVVRLLR